MKNCFFAVDNKIGRTQFSSQEIRGRLSKKAVKAKKYFSTECKTSLWKPELQVFVEISGVAGILKLCNFMSSYPSQGNDTK